MPENYKALTRKYRPRFFDDIVSQEHVSNTLKNAIEQNRLSHAYMFCGPRGVGKTTMARVLARTINELDADIDGEALGNTLNIIEIDAASNNKVEDVHRIRETVRIPPQNGRYKIYIIDEVHMLSKQAYNALLKTLEEPPAHVIFIFATTEPQKVLPTIMSRCQRFDFHRIKVEEIVDHLKEICQHENIKIDEESLHVIAHKADGALRDALSIMDQAIAFCGNDIKQDELLRALNVVSTESLFLLMDAIQNHDADSGLQLIDKLLQEGNDIQEFLVSLTEHFRNLYIAKGGKSMHLIESSEETKVRYRQYAETFSEDDLMRMLHIANEAQFKIREAHQPRIQLEISVLKLITMQRSEGFHKLLKQLENLKSESLKTTPAAEKKQAPLTSNKDHSGKVDTHSVTSSSKTTPSASPQKSNPGKEFIGSPAVRAKNSLSSVSLNLHRGAIGNNNNEDENGKNLYDNSVNGNLALAPKPSVEEPEAIQFNDKKWYLHDIKEIWNDYLSNAAKSNLIQDTVVWTLKKAIPTDLKENELTLQCQDAFMFQMLEQHRRPLTRILQQTTRSKLIVSCVLNENNQKQESYDPYSRFRELQKKDPILRTIVELFGAELEY